MLPKAQFDEVAQKVANFTGLPADYVKDAALTGSRQRGRSRKELLRGDEKTQGRYDARFARRRRQMLQVKIRRLLTRAIRRSAESSSALFHDYIQSELEVHELEPYYLSGPGINQNWDWKHRPSGAQGFRWRWPRRRVSEPDTVLDLSDAKWKNPHLRVFSAENGWYDYGDTILRDGARSCAVDASGVEPEEFAVRLLPGGAHGLL